MMLGSESLRFPTRWGNSLNGNSLIWLHSVLFLVGSPLAGEPSADLEQVVGSSSTTIRFQWKRIYSHFSDFCATVAPLIYTNIKPMNTS